MDKSVDVVAIIPARFASSRFPGKLLARDTGKYLIQHVYEQVAQATEIGAILVATDDERIAQACREFGAEPRMTRADHPCGTNRVAEVAAQLDASIIVNVQGDEPEIDPAHIDLAVNLLRQDAQAHIATLAAPVTNPDERDNPNVVKVVTDRQGRALYFSRCPIPYHRTDDREQSPPCYRKHLGLYAYRRDALLRLSQLEPTPLEQAEKLEQLRALENGLMIAVRQVEHPAVGIDTPEQYRDFLQRYRKVKTISTG